MRYFIYFITIALPIVFLLVLVGVPFGAMLNYDDNAVLWQDIWQDDYYRQRFVWSVFQAACSAILCVILALPMAWSLARLQFWGRKWLLRLLMLPFIMPTLVAGMGVLALFGERGVVNLANTPYLLIYGNVFFNLPVAIGAMYQGYCRVPAHHLAMAQTLGANAWQRFWYVEMPVLRSWLIGAMCLIFLYCFSGFGLALLLGGQKYATIEVVIYQLIAYELDMSRAVVLVWLALGITAVAGGLYAWFSRGQVNKIIFRQPEKPSSSQKIILMFSLLILLFFCGLPLLAVVVRALQAWSAWGILLTHETLLALKNTLFFSLVTVILATILGVTHAALAHEVVWVRGMTFLPFMVSPVCLAFGVLLAYPEWSASLPLLMALYALMAYPFVTKDILSIWDTLSPHYVAVTRTLGATSFQAACYVTVPLLLPALRRGLIFAAATAMGEFAATLFLSRPEWLTLTTLIYQKLGRVGQSNFHEAMILTLLLMVLSVMVFLLLDTKET